MQIITKYVLFSFTIILSVSVKLTPSSRFIKYELICLKQEAYCGKIRANKQRRENKVLAEAF